MPADFDPSDPPQESSGNPLADYQRAPGGLQVVAIFQLIIALLLVVVVASALRSAGAPAYRWVLNMLPAGLFAASAAGLFLRRGWGWWMTCSIHCLVFFSMPVALVLWTFHRADFSAPAQLFCFVCAVLVVGYLNRPEVMRFVRFGTPDRRPAPRTRMTPVVVGLLGAVIRLVAEWIRHSG